jgi:hypothetical protein
LSGVFFREEKRKYQTPNKRPHPKVQYTQWVANECIVHVAFVPWQCPNVSDKNYIHNLHPRGWSDWHHKSSLCGHKAYITLV